MERATRRFEGTAHIGTPEHEAEYLAWCVQSLRDDERRLAWQASQHARSKDFIRRKLAELVERDRTCNHTRTAIIEDHDDDMDGIIIDGERRRICRDCHQTVEYRV